MNMSGQLHKPATLAPREVPSVAFGYEVGWGPETVRTLWRTEIFLTLDGKLYSNGF